MSQEFFAGHVENTGKKGQLPEKRDNWPEKRDISEGGYQQSKLLFLFVFFYPLARARKNKEKL